MADEASETASGGFKAYLGTLAFCCALLGLEEVLRALWENGPAWRSGHLWLGLFLTALALPIYQSPAIWRRLRRGKAEAEQRLQYLSNEDTELGVAIMMMGMRSAWSKWFASQSLANNNHRPTSEASIMQIATGLVSQELVDGKLQARGRMPGQLNYEPIPREHWRSTVPHMVPDERSIWKLMLIPTGGAEFNPNGTVLARDQAAQQRNAQLQAYDSIIVSSHEFEMLWPRRDEQTDKARKRLLKAAKKAGADKTEIAKLSGD
jgi:hypothetical protein